MSSNYLNEVSQDSKSAIWKHYYDNQNRERENRGKTKTYRRITKKEIIVRTLKKKAPQGETVELQDLSRSTGLSPHDLSGHLTHLVNEGKVVRRGRGLFAPSEEILSDNRPLDNMGNIVTRVVKGIPSKQIEERIVINDKDHSENRRMLLDFLNDLLLNCSEVEVSVKCKKDQKNSMGSLCIELKAQ